MHILSGHLVRQVLYESPRTRVYRAVRLLDGVPVIIKLLSQPHPSAERRARFEEEYRLMQRLKRNVVPIVFSLEQEQGAPAIVMEDFGGISLDLLERSCPLSIADWLRLAIQIAERLEQLHAQYVMHKDINPSNIVWNRDTGQLRFIDLGLATELTREVAQASGPERLVESLAYISPEQTGRMNRVVDYRTDFYSLGVTLYELLTGRLPFESSDPRELLHAHIAQKPAPAAQVSRAIPAMLSAIIDKLLSKYAEDRYHSAAGLVSDLYACLQKLDRQGQIPPFELGTADFSYRLDIPQKLYGRERDVATLLDAYERAAQGPGELLLVTGYSGVGKSALVHEIQKPATRHRGYFIEGKFDQFKRSIPYSALSQAFNGLIRQLLNEGDVGVEHWKNRLLQMLGSNGQLIIEVIPDLQSLIGAQPAVPRLPPEQTQARFTYLFREFVGAVATVEHPLAIFLDDLQWADLPSLTLISLLLEQPACRHVLVIGAYRDNEITPAHPLPGVIREATRRGVAMRTITLAPLGMEQVCRLLSDALHADNQRIDPLAKLCLAKTQGNPFFLNQFLNLLVAQNRLYMDPVRQEWQWDMAGIEQADITDNVVELMTGRLKQLSRPTLQVLLGAACLGNVFDLKTLALACAMPPGEAAQCLWPALEAGLVMPLDERYRYAQFVGQDDAAVAPKYRFLHDRVQQAALTLSGEQERAAMHLAIGRMWQRSLSEPQRQSALFDLVNHFNLGRDLLETEGERRQLAQWNLEAARKAKASGAYRPGLRYAQAGLELLGQADWTAHYELAFGLHLEAAELAYLATDFDEMDCYMQILSGYAADVLDRARICELRIQALIAQNRLQEALFAGLKGLDMLGIRAPWKMTKLQTMLYLLRLKSMLAADHAERLLSLPEMKDARMLAAIGLLRQLVSAAYIRGSPYLVYILYTSLRLISSHGRVSTIYNAYSLSALLLGGRLKAIEQASRLCEMALRSQENMLGAERYRFVFTMHYFIRPWTRPLHESVEPLRENYLRCMETGDGEFAAYSAQGWAAFGWYAGFSLPELERGTAAYCNAMKQIERSHTYNQLRILLDGMQDLMSGRTTRDERTWQAIQQGAIVANKTVLFNFHCVKLMVSYLFNDHDKALEATNEIKGYLDSMLGFAGVSTARLYDSLTRLAMLESLSPVQQHRAWAMVRKNQKALARSAEFCPANFLHKWHLVEAEAARCSGRPRQAIEHYAQAIRLAAEHGYVHEEALANELAGAFYLRSGQMAAAVNHLEQAHRGYLRWGALAKVSQLEECYPEVLAESRTARSAHPLPHIVIMSGSGTNSRRDYIG